MDLSDRNLPNKTNLKFDQDFKACWSFFFELKVLNEFNAMGALCPWQCLNIFYICCQIMVRQQSLKPKYVLQVIFILLWFRCFKFEEKTFRNFRSFNQLFGFCLACLCITFNYFFPSKSTKVSFCHWPLLHWWISPWAESIRPHSR